jgi:osmotically inducible protein OsmC
MNFAKASILRTSTDAKPPFEEKAMSIVKKASAHWEGDLKSGLGSISTETGVLREAPYGFKARFEGGKGTNPEELIGAAHAGCFSMAFSMILGDAGLKADSIDTQAEVTLDQVDGGFAITAVHLVLKAKIPGASQAQFEELSKKAKEGCPVSKVLKATITLDATLVN